MLRARGGSDALRAAGEARESRLTKIGTTAQAPGAKLAVTTQPAGVRLGALAKASEKDLPARAEAEARSLLAELAQLPKAKHAVFLAQYLEGAGELPP